MISVANNLGLGGGHLDPALPLPEYAMILGTISYVCPVRQVHYGYITAYCDSSKGLSYNDAIKPFPKVTNTEHQTIGPGH